MKRAFVIICSILLCQSFYSFGQKVKANLDQSPDKKTHNTLLIPNAFTPNHDGRNDIFKINNFTNEKLLEFKVFNRWGTILYQTNNPQTGWNGTYKNKPLPIGVYGYVIRIAYHNKVIETYRGTVTLLK